MEKLSMCRICLATNARMNVLLDTYLQEIYEELTAMPLITTDKRPTLACYICSARLRTCYQLRMKCLQSEKFFTQILESHVMESTNLEIISSADALKITPVVHLSMGDVVQESELHSVHVEVKQEPLEIEVTVKREDSEDDENVFLQEYNITSSRDNVRPISPDDFIMDTAPVNSKEDILRVKSEDIPTLVLAKENSTKRKNVAVISNTRNNALYDNENLKHDKSSHKCRVCQKRYINKFSLIKHNCKHSVVKQHKCEVCLNFFCSSSSLRRHTRRAHNSNKLYTCDICGKTFVCKEYLKSHIRVHELHQCNICKKLFSSKNSLQRHINIIHTRKGTPNSNIILKLFACDICKKNFTNKGQLVTHMRTHTGEKPYQCDICKKSFSERSTLNKHVLVHSDDKPFQCDKCDKGFKRKSHLDTHTLLHTGDRPFECEVCSKSFNQNVHLRDHMRVHTGEKPFPCDFCDEWFAYKSSIKRHILRTHHTRDKSYPCDLCDERFAYKSSIKRHILRRHNVETS